MRRSRAPRAPGDAGFTLVEVVVAVVLLGLVTTAVLPFFLQSLNKGADLQERQAGVAVANAALEQARSVVATQASLGTTAAPSVVTALVRGRAQADVQAQWSAAGESTATTTPRWDPQPGTAVVNARVKPPDLATRAVVPLQRTDTVSAVRYTSQTLIGTCRRPRTTPAAPCTATAAGVAPTDVEMVRLVVITSWQPLNGGSCPASQCSYRLSSLVDPTVDPEWLSGAGTVRDDSIGVAAGATVVVDVLLNDSVILDGTPSPVTLRGTVPPGASARTDGKVVYTPPASVTAGTVVAIVYSVRNGAGSETGQAVVRVTVTP